MAKRIAVSDSLAPIKRYLHNEGFEVVNMESDARISEKGMGDYDAIIVSGMDDNLMGMEDISSRAVVINAAGKPPQEISAELREKLL